MIGSDEPAQFRGGMACGKLTDGIDGVAGPPATEFEVVDGKVGAASEGDPEPLEAERVGGGRNPRLEGRTGCRNEDDAVEGHFLARGFRHQKVTEVDGIEGSSIEADAHGGFSSSG